MRVENILDTKGRKVETIELDADLRLVVNKLATLGIGSLVVSDDGRKLAGVISDRDVVRGLNKHGEAFLDLRVKDVMTRGAATCAPGDTLQHVMGLMTRTRQRHLPVIDEKGAICGIVSIGDVVKHRLEEMELEVNVLRDRYIASR